MASGRLRLFFLREKREKEEKATPGGPFQGRSGRQPSRPSKPRTEERASHFAKAWGKLGSFTFRKSSADAVDKAREASLAPRQNAVSEALRPCFFFGLVSLGLAAVLCMSLSQRRYFLQGEGSVTRPIVLGFCFPFRSLKWDCNRKIGNRFITWIGPLGFIWEHPLGGDSGTRSH